LSLSACPGVGNRPPSENKFANPRGYTRGGMATGRIEPCISGYVQPKYFQDPRKRLFLINGLVTYFKKLW